LKELATSFCGTGPTLVLLPVSGHCPTLSALAALAEGITGWLR